MIRRFRAPEPYDLFGTLWAYGHGPADPTTRTDASGFWRATRTPVGPATVNVTRDGDGVRVETWGPGAEHALDHADQLLGLHDDPGALIPRHHVIRDLHRRFRGLRIGRTNAVLESLVPSILEQKVTTKEAWRSYTRLVRAHGEPAPGPWNVRAPGAPALMLSPEPARLAALPYWAFHRFGIERKRAETIRRACAHAARLERAATLDASEAQRLLQAIPGVGPWTAAEVARVALGDPDAVSVGDYHLPHQVAWVLAGEERGDDARMLELLEPYRGQRGRAILLIERAGLGPPRRAPRARLRSIERI